MKTIKIKVSNQIVKRGEKGILKANQLIKFVIKNVKNVDYEVKPLNEIALKDLKIEGEYIKSAFLNLEKKELKLILKNC
ncbi:hypothetical protein [Clostridium haemolyticum]|uniref:Uncharacterized protein n=1 Tax=Clostridium haemolyticum NCTC 9693 TaxID=1443114 RepID=A0ABR4TI27_CLOHA|nr:hypothetical protein [Clostridium haemolyticum]KEI18276.1 hypothetical protein Z960_03955 [Clostridium haemolyticum NCTC 9693]KGN04200.1 hypothetical protein Z961_04430 [Clostridium haemolyticum NCTC 8350]